MCLEEFSSGQGKKREKYFSVQSLNCKFCGRQPVNSGKSGKPHIH
jgi:hypothetical protein